MSYATWIIVNLPRHFIVDRLIDLSMSVEELVYSPVYSGEY